jgi:hypothetical protein
VNGQEREQLHAMRERSRALISGELSRQAVARMHIALYQSLLDKLNQ